MTSRAHRIASGLWIRLEWILSALAAPLAVVLMRQRGFGAGATATAVCAAALAFTLFELHHPQQWRAMVFGRRGLGPLVQPPERVRALFAGQLAARQLDPRRVLLAVSAEADVARSRDVGPFHLVELHPATAAGPSSLLRALFAHELAHVAHRDPLLKRALCGLLVPACTLLAALSAGMMETELAGPLGLAMALLASATLLPWAYASLQAISFALELRADREAAQLLGDAGPLFELLDCLDDGGQPYRLSRPPPETPPELVQRETDRLLEELLYLLPAHPPTWERRRRLLALQQGRLPRRATLREVAPALLASTAPLLVAVVLGALAVQLAGPPGLRPLQRATRLVELAPATRPPPVHTPESTFATPDTSFLGEPPRKIGANIQP